MSDSQVPPADDSSPAENDMTQEDLSLNLPDDLPPVEPPSAGMIIQLFLVPAIIVAVIVGVYAAFGQLASQELDWRQLVTDVRSQNPHVRWRGALGLAQMLDADAQRGEESQNLAANSEIATALSELYEEFIPLQELNEEELKNLEFLSKALGRMRTQEIVVPIFRKGIAPDKDRDVRKHSLIGLSMHAGNVQAAGNELFQPEVINELIDISKEGDPLLRHQAAYALGLFPSKKSKDRLIALLDNPDLMTQTNAAIGLSRNGSDEGIPVFFEMLETAQEWDLDPTQVQTEEQESEYFERMLILVNSLKALDEVQSKMSTEQKTELVSLLDKLAEQSKDAVLRSQILEIKQTL